MTATRDPKIRHSVLARDGGNCAGCGLEDTLLSLFHVDHVIPLNHGGTDTADNCQVLCLTCHRRKTVLERSCFKQPGLVSATVKVRKLRDIGDMVQAVRRSRMLSQEELAHETACDRFYVNRLETGNSTLYITRLLRILKYLHVTITLTYGSEEENA